MGPCSTSRPAPRCATSCSRSIGRAGRGASHEPRQMRAHQGRDERPARTCPAQSVRPERVAGQALRPATKMTRTSRTRDVRARRCDAADAHPRRERSAPARRQRRREHHGAEHEHACACPSSSSRRRREAPSQPASSLVTEVPCHRYRPRRSTPSYERFTTTRSTSQSTRSSARPLAYRLSRFVGSGRRSI